MSSPPPSSPPMEFPSSEIGDEEMEDATLSTPSRNANPLFMAGSSPARSNTSGRTPARGNPLETPMRNVAARRALGLSTPRRAPRSGAAPSSPILNFPSSSPQKSVRHGAVASSSGLVDSDPLDFPS